MRWLTSLWLAGSQSRIRLEVMHVAASPDQLCWERKSDYWRATPLTPEARSYSIWTVSHSEVPEVTTLPRIAPRRIQTRPVRMVFVRSRGLDVRKVTTLPRLAPRRIRTEAFRMVFTRFRGLDVQKVTTLPRFLGSARGPVGTRPGGLGDTSGPLAGFLGRAGETPYRE